MGGDVGNFSLTFLISADSSRVVYLADQDVNDVSEIYSVPIAGGAAVKLNAPLVSGGDVEPFRFLVSPDSRFVLYHAPSPP